jgi:hypothetical protein
MNPSYEYPLQILIDASKHYNAIIDARNAL